MNNPQIPKIFYTQKSNARTKNTNGGTLGANADQVLVKLLKNSRRLPQLVPTFPLKTPTFALKTPTMALFARTMDFLP
jgi:hypothetical protein